MPRAGSQIVLCDVPLRVDSLVGCQHNCKYCFTRRKCDEKIGMDVEVEKGESPTTLLNFIKGDRKGEVNWVGPDEKFPLHFGGMSDGFQPAEKKHHITLEYLKIFAETKYPVIISTKGSLSVEPEYLDLLRNCNVCMQVSLVSPNYDALEPGAPPFWRRVEMIRILAKNTPRVVVRIQPYMLEELDTVLATTLPAIQEAGAHGLVIESMKFYDGKQPGTIAVGSDFVYPVDVLKYHFDKIKDKAKSIGLAFYCGENRLRGMGDSLTCCGCADMPGFTVNKLNLNHIYAGEEVEATPAQKAIGSTVCFKTLCQSAWGGSVLDQLSFDQMMRGVAQSKFGYKIMGLDVENKEKVLF